MKRMVFFFVFFSYGLSLLAGTITVTSPSASDNWMIGTTHDIQWTYAGFADPSAQTVTIRLWKGSQQVCLIAGGVPLTAGHYSWNLNPNACAGLVAGTYRVRVRIPQAELDDSDDFTISGQVQGTITVTSPNGGERWLIGKTYNIRWTSSGKIIPANVKIILKKGGTNVWDQSVPNTGTFSWLIPHNTALGSDYKIRIEGSATIFDESNKSFSIRPQIKKWKPPQAKMLPVVESAKAPYGFQPGAGVHFYGKYFGTKTGEILMYGNFKNYGYGPPVKLINLWWENSTHVKGVIPLVTRGEPNQTVEIKVRTADNLFSNPWKMNFKGREEKILREGDVFVVQCGDDGNSNTCNNVSSIPSDISGDVYVNPPNYAGLIAIDGGHGNVSGAVGDDVGDDIYQITLKNGWKFKDMQIVKWYKSSGDEVLTGPNPPFPVGKSFWEPKIHWKVTPGDSVWYQIKIIVEGPLGTHYK